VSFGRAVLAILLPACVACVLFPAAALAGTLDQQQPVDGGGAFSVGTNQNVAQTFTAGLSGKIDQVDLHLGKVGAPVPLLSVEIRSVSAGIPTGTGLAAASVAASSIPASSAFVPITFASPATVVAGTQYAIVASSATPPVTDYYEWSNGTPASPYAGGTALVMSPASSGSWTISSSPDLTFKTYVVPTAAGGTGERAAALKRCKKKHSHKARKKCKKKANKLPV
jgi:hypothetical protein